MIKLKKKNYFFVVWAVSAALLVGFIYVFPHVLRSQELNKQGKDYIAWTQESDMDMANVHAGRYREIIDGNLFAGEIDTFEHKDAPAMWPMLSADIFAPILMLSKSVTFTLVVTDFIFPILMLFSFFLIISVITKNRYFALGVSFLAMIFPQLSLFIPPGSLKELEVIVRQLLPVVIDDKIVANLMFIRRDAFIPAGPFFILSFYFIYQTIINKKEEKNTRFIILAGIGYGLSFYFYIYFWLFISIFLGVLFLLLLIKKQKQLAKKIFFIGVTGLIVSIPFWINHFQLASLPQYDEITKRAGLEIGRSIRFSLLWKTYILYSLLAGAVLFLGAKIKKQKTTLFLFGIIVSEMLALNIQILTGFNIQSDHWATRVFILVNVFILSFIFYYFYIYFKKYFLRIKFQKWIAPVFIILVSFIFSNIVHSQIKTEIKKAHLHSIPKEQAEVYDWLNNNTPKDSVIMNTTIEDNVDLPIYTHNRIFLSRGTTTVGSEEEIVERFFITYRMFGFDHEYIDEILQESSYVRYLFAQSYDNTGLDIYLDPTVYEYYVLPDQVKIDLVNRYKEFILPEILPYRLDYILTDSHEGFSNFASQDPKKYELLYKQESMEIYKFNN